MDFTVVITEDPEAPGTYNAAVPAIPGCFSFGATKDEAYANVKEALAGCLAVMKEDGDPIPVETEAKTIHV